MSAGAAAPGYRSPAYAAALTQAGLGRPRPLGATGGHVLARPVPGSGSTGGGAEQGGGRIDLSGPYPLFCCTDWSALAEALAAPKDDPVSLVLVADPFCPLGEAELAAAFDLCRPLNEHWLIALDRPLSPSRHHRRKLRGAGPARIEAGPADPGLAEAWIRLYSTLIARKQIADARAFPPASLAAQLQVPGAHLVTAWEGTALIGADLYYLDGEVARAHLSAYAPEGYARSISYPMIAAAAEYFAPRAALIDLGGAPAVEAGRRGGGVAHFKRGWTSLSRPSRLCGKIFDRAAYAALSGGAGGGWFPAYRAGEFAAPAASPAGPGGAP